MIFSMKTDKGIVREINQDGYFVTAFDENTCFAVVCDGMGGPKAGDIASEMAIKNISERFVSAWRKDISPSSVRNLITTAFSAANILIFDEAQDNKDYEGMGTTAVAVYISDCYALIANVGDSRAYLAGDTISQITKDHSLMQELIDTGKLDEVDAKYFPYKNLITRALGIKEHIEIDFYEVNVNENDSILLCSDGLTNYVGDNDILKIINESEINKTAENLVDAANSNGGGDNITVVVLSNKG